MKYTELLKLAKKHKINILKLTIAYELESLLNEQLDEEPFNELCEQVYDIYLSTETYDVEIICATVLVALTDEEEREILINEYDEDLEEYVRQTLCNNRWY